MNQNAGDNLSNTDILACAHCWCIRGAETTRLLLGLPNRGTVHVRCCHYGAVGWLEGHEEMRPVHGHGAYRREVRVGGRVTIVVEYSLGGNALG